jgi:hypothetical protein
LQRITPRAIDSFANFFSSRLGTFSAKASNNRSTKFRNEDWFIMTIIPMMRAGALAMTLAAGALLVQGCSSPDQTMTAQGTRLLGSSGISTGAVNSGPYSGPDSEAAQDAAMTSDNGGE